MPASPTEVAPPLWVIVTPSDAVRVKAPTAGGQTFGLLRPKSRALVSRTPLHLSPSPSPPSRSPGFEVIALSVTITSPPTRRVISWPALVNALLPAAVN